jgi:hypothetical protein
MIYPLVRHFYCFLVALWLVEVDAVGTGCVVVENFGLLGCLARWGIDYVIN